MGLGYLILDDRDLLPCLTHVFIHANLAIKINGISNLATDTQNKISPNTQRVNVNTSIAQPYFILLFLIISRTMLLKIPF